jgi:large subunit ribosomal protein L3
MWAMEIRANHFVAGQFVDVIGTTKGKGFAGAMKRWNFAGLEASHGVSVSHRSHGSTGQRQDPGRVSKAKRWRVTWVLSVSRRENLKIVQIDEARNLLLIKGAVPGVDNRYVRVVDAHKRARPANASVPCSR